MLISHFTFVISYNYFLRSIGVALIVNIMRENILIWLEHVLRRGNIEAVKVV